MESSSMLKGWAKVITLFLANDMDLLIKATPTQAQTILKYA